MRKRIASGAVMMVFALTMVGCSSGNDNASAGAAESKSSAIEVGDTITMGEYEQDNDTSDGKEAIEWKVLAKEDGRVLLVSDKVLDYQAYNDGYASFTWDTSTLRTWLNDDFYSEAFSLEEQDTIQLTTMKAEESTDENRSVGTDTEDKVFLLSNDESNTYFSSDADRQAEPTEFAKGVAGTSLDGKNSCAWWLSSLGPDTSNSMAFVQEDGSIYDGGAIGAYPQGVRPAMWITQ